jgi:hypothetical protein
MGSLRSLLYKSQIPISWLALDDEVCWIEKSKRNGEMHCILSKEDDNLDLLIIWERWKHLHLVLKEPERSSLSYLYAKFKSISFSRGLRGLSVDPEKLDPIDLWKNNWQAEVLKQNPNAKLPPE